MVEDTVEQLVARGVPIRALSLQAKERAYFKMMWCRVVQIVALTQYYDKVQEHIYWIVWDRGMVKADHLKTRSFVRCVPMSCPEILCSPQMW